MNAAVIHLWAQVLAALSGSRLLLLCPEGEHRRNILAAFGAQGIAPGRIDLCAPRPHRDYMQLYHRIDIGLDTFPYNGHTTSLDSFWMGVPVVSLVGSTVVGRAGLSQLSNLGLAELAALSSAEFVRIAAALASDVPRLRDLRATLRDRMLGSPLMDAPRFARDLEQAYRQIWRTWCARASHAKP